MARDGTCYDENDDIEQDIRDYISYQVDYDPRLRRWGDRRERIKEYLAQHAAGVFRWVECQLVPLRRCARSVKHLEDCLRALPQSLDETYERMLCSIGDESRDEAQRILSLLCYSPRPLTADEVIEAIAVDVDDLVRYDGDRKLESADDLLRICPGLIEVSLVGRTDDDSGFRDEDAEFDEEKETMRAQLVRIAHFSVQEYLVSERIRQSRAADFALLGPVEHLRISKTCLLYLDNEDFVRQVLTQGLIQQYPFAKFAARNWHYHYQQAGDELAQQLSERTFRLLTATHIFDRWIRLHNPDRPRVTEVSYVTSAEDHPGSTYCAALLGLDSALAGILSMSQDGVNAQGGVYGNALQAASFRGHEKVVQMLLDHGADVNAQGGRYGNALQAASYEGHKKVVQMLLDHGADINAQGGEYGNALQAASRGGHEEVVQMLLDHGAGVNAQGGRYGNALQATSYEGHKKVVQMLLDEGADVNPQGGEYRCIKRDVRQEHEQNKKRC